MRDGWREGSFGDVLREVRRPVRVSDLADVPFAGVRWYAEGVYPRDVVPASTVKTMTLSEIRTGDIVYNRMWATKASFGIVRQDSDGCLVTNDFPSFRADEDVVLTDYVGLVFQWRPFQQAASLSATGTTERRRLHERDFRGLRLPLPPLVEQRRIVDLIGTLDEVIDEVSDSLKAIRRVLAALRQATPSTDSVALGSLVRMRSGPSWKAADETTTPTPSSTPVLGITNTKPDGSIDLSTRKYVANLSGSTDLLDENSLVMIRTNGNRNRIGNIYRATKDLEGFAVSAFQFAIQPLDPADRDYLYWILGSSAVQQRITAAASGTTGLGNIAQGWLKELRIPYPTDRLEVEEYVERCEQVNAVVQAFEAEAAALTRTRSRLISLLLSGEHEIPASYDELIEEVA